MIVQITFLAAVLIFLLSLFFYKSIFLRNPKRKIPLGNNVVSPADGKAVNVLNINNVKEKKEIKLKKGLAGVVSALTSDVIKKGYLIQIVMNIHNVHYQRAPFSGIVEKIVYSKGKFLNAVRRPENMRAMFENEKNEIVLKTKIGRIKVIQIAGVLARRIECFVHENQKINKGQIIGRINLGSQVVLVVPEIDLMIGKGDKVKAGSTVIGNIGGHQDEKF